MTASPPPRSLTTTIKALFSALSANCSPARRDRLFARLRRELELLGRLDLEHVAPALARSPQTQARALAAAADLQRTLTRLEELAQTDRAAPGFSHRLDELRRSFQPSLRGADLQLLPQVQDALSVEDAVGLARALNAHATQAALFQDAEELSADAGDAPACEAAASGVEAKPPMVRHDRPVEGRRVEAAAPMSWLQRSAQSQLRAYRALLQCRTPADLVAVQSRLARETLQLMFGMAAGGRQGGAR